MRFRYIFFDFDGTIADTENVNFKIHENLADKYKFKKISHDELQNMKKMGALQVMYHLDIKKYKLPFILRKGKKLLKQNIIDVELCKKDFKDVLCLLRDKGIKLAIITSNSRKNVKLFLKKHDLECFDFVASSSLFGKEYKIKKIIKKGLIDSNEVLYVGDEIRDIQAAKLSNIKIAVVSWGYNSIDSLLNHDPDYILRNASDLVDVCDVSNMYSYS